MRNMFLDRINRIYMISRVGVPSWSWRAVFSTSFLALLLRAKTLALNPVNHVNPV